MNFSAATLRNNAFRESFLRQRRKQRLYNINDTHFLDKVGDYHGMQYEKSVLESDGTAKIESVHIVAQTVTSSNGTATVTVVSGELQIGSGWICDIVLSDGTWYSLGESNGTDAYNRALNSNHATITGGATWTTKKDETLINYTTKYGYSLDGNVITPRIVNSDLDAQGNSCQFLGKVASDMKMVNSNCVSFDGVNGYAQSTMQINASNSYDISIRFKTSVSTSSILLDARYAVMNGIKVQTKQDGLIFTHNTTNINVGNYSDNLWHRIRATWDGTFISVYVDGILKDTVAVGVGISSTSNFTVGARSFSAPISFFNGNVADLKINTDGVQVDFNLAEGTGTTCYAREEETKTLALIGGVTWNTQDEFHANITKGFSKGVNKIDHSEDFNQWSTNYAPKSEFLTSGFTDHLGGNKAFRINNALGQNFTLQRPIEDVANHTISMWIKSNNGLTQNRSFLYGNNAANGTVLNITTEWQRFSFTSSGTSGFGNTWGIYSITGEVDVLIAFAQMEEGSEMSDYQRTYGSSNEGVKLPYKTDGTYSNPTTFGHNGAETQLQMEVFREDLADSDFHYDQTDYSSEEIDFDNLVDSNDEVFVTELTGNKLDIETFLPANAAFKYKRKNNGFRKSGNSLR